MEKDYKSQRNKKFSMRLHLLEMSEKQTHEVSSKYLSKQDPNKDNTNRHANVGRGTLMWTQS